MMKTAAMVIALVAVAATRDVFFKKARATPRRHRHFFLSLFAIIFVTRQVMANFFVAAYRSQMRRVETRVN